MYVCLWSPAWSTGGASPGAEPAPPGGEPASPGGESAPRVPEPGPVGGAPGPSAVVATRDVAPLLADLAPRLRVEREVIWADGRGLDAMALAGRLLARLAESGVEGARAGVAAVPIAAELAARWGPREADGGEGPTPFLVKERTGWGWRRTGRVDARVVRADRAGAGAGGADPGGATGEEERAKAEAGSEAFRAVVAVERGGEAAWMAGLPLGALRPGGRLRPLLEGVGVETVGELAGLAREAVEVRFGAEAVALWRLARADDGRRLFLPVPPERPHGSIDFVDYVLTDPSRLLFTANALLGPLCDRLVGRGEHARTLRLTLPLADGSEWERTLRPARPTASRDSWLRLIRGLLERLTVPDAVAGMRLEVGATEAAAVRQGDLFDRGFASAAAVEAAVARLAELQVVPLAPEVAGHPRLERRSRWRTLSPDAVAVVSAASTSASSSRSRDGGSPGLALQLLPSPRPLAVETVARRDHEVPVRLRDRGGWREVSLAAGPDRISGGQWEAAPYAREYYRCVTAEGVQLWVYRDGLNGGWYLHGYWD